jgi:hypothetical protein
VNPYAPPGADPKPRNAEKPKRGIPFTIFLFFFAAGSVVGLVSMAIGRTRFDSTAMTTVIALAQASRIVSSIAIYRWKWWGVAGLVVAQLTLAGLGLPTGTPLEVIVMGTTLFLGLLWWFVSRRRESFA